MMIFSRGIAELLEDLPCEEQDKPKPDPPASATTSSTASTGFSPFVRPESDDLQNDPVDDSSSMNALRENDSFNYDVANDMNMSELSSPSRAPAQASSGYFSGNFDLSMSSSSSSFHSFEKESGPHSLLSHYDNGMMPRSPIRNPSMFGSSITPRNLTNLDAVSFSSPIRQPPMSTLDPIDSPLSANLPPVEIKTLGQQLRERRLKFDQF